MVDMCWEYVGKNAPWADVNIPRKHFDDIILPNMGVNSMIRDMDKGIKKIGGINASKSPLNPNESNITKGKKYKDFTTDKSSNQKIKENSEIDELNISKRSARGWEAGIEVRSGSPNMSSSSFQIKSAFMKLDRGSPRENSHKESTERVGVTPDKK